MPELPLEVGQVAPPLVDTTSRLAQPRRPVPWPGMPVGLETLSPRERAYHGRRFGIDRPFLWAPSGWGEMVPLTGSLAGIDPAAIIEGVRGPLALPEVFPTAGRFPEAGLYPQR